MILQKHLLNRSQLFQFGATLLACSIVSLILVFLGSARLDPPSVVISCARPSLPEVQKAIEGLDLKNVGVSLRDPQEFDAANMLVMFLTILGILIPATLASLGLYNYFCRFAKIAS